MKLPTLPKPPVPKRFQDPPVPPGEPDKLTALEQVKETGIGAAAWVDERTSLAGGVRWMFFRKVPKGTNWFYTLGSATMFAFVSQAITGVFLAMYYTPSPTQAYESARHITNDVFLGEFVRGMHKWGSSVMVILIFLHMARTFFFGAYKYPRELNWIIGVVLIILTFVMSLTGYLLPFDQRSYWATIVAANINGTGPSGRTLPVGLPERRRRLRGDDLVEVLRDPHDARARDHRGAHRRAPLPRRPARHDGPAVAAGRQGREAPRGAGMNQQEKEEYLREYALLKSKGKPFFPYAVAKDSVMMVVVMAVIITMSIVLGAELGPKADPTTTTYVPRPEWYFFFLFEVLRVIKPPELVPFATIGVPTVCMILLFLLPFIDRGPERRPERRPIATIAGILTIVGDGLPDLHGRGRRLAELDRHGRAGEPREGQTRRRPVGLPRLPQDRRERQRRARPAPDRDRQFARAGRDPAHAREPHRSHALLPQSP